MDTFRKRTFTATTLLRAGGQLCRHLPGLIWAYLFRGVTAAFSERLLLVVSGVNGCSYCSWFHSRMAIRNGVEPEEVTQLLQQLIPKGAVAGEAPALLFAIHYAESNGRPDPEQLGELRDHYTPRQLRGILGLCSAIHFGNLSGNTFDAFLHRLKGQPVTGGNIAIELLLFLCCAPFLLPLLGRVNASR